MSNWTTTDVSPYGTIRTDGTRWQRKHEDVMDTDISLAEHIRWATGILQEGGSEHTITTRSLRYDDGNEVVVEWWEDIEETHDAVIKYRQKAVEAAERRAEYDRQELERIKARSPHLFEKP